MNKNLFLLIAALLLLWIAPQQTFAQDDDKEEMENQVSPKPSIEISGTQVCIHHAMGKNLKIYNVTGVEIATYRIDSSNKKINLMLPKGMYLLSVDKVVRRISIR